MGGNVCPSRPSPKGDGNIARKAYPKEWLYVGHYVDTQGRYILKIGTTNDLERRRKEHTRNYRKAAEYTLPADKEMCMPGDNVAMDFQYDWKLRLSKYNTLRFEDLNRNRWKESKIGVFVRNDRFCTIKKPETVSVVIRREYISPLKC